MFCPHCGAGVREGAKFCPSCGQAIASAGFGLLAAIVVSIFPAIAFTQLTSADDKSGMSMLELGSSYNPFSEFMGLEGPNFFHYLLLNVAFGISGSVAPQAADSGSTSAELAISLPLGLTGIALVIAATAAPVIACEQRR